MNGKGHNQKGRKNSKILSFLCPMSLLREIDDAVASQRANTLRAPLSGRSEWIIRAIKRDLDHRRRSNRKRPKHADSTKSGIASDDQAQFWLPNSGGQGHGDHGTEVSSGSSSDMGDSDGRNGGDLGSGESLREVPSKLHLGTESFSTNP